MRTTGWQAAKISYRDALVARSGIRLWPRHPEFAPFCLGTGIAAAFSRGRAV